MVQYLSVVSIENQWLYSCKFDLDKNNIPDRIIGNE